MTTPFVDAVGQDVLVAVEQEPAIATVYLFGSFGTTSFHHESDIDLGILFFQKMVPHGMEFFDLKDRLSTRLHCEVDVVCLHKADPIISMQVLRKGRIILDRNPRLRHEFFVRTVSFYADLKRVRRPIEAEISRGHVFS